MNKQRQTRRKHNNMATRVHFDGLSRSQKQYLSIKAFTEPHINGHIVEKHVKAQYNTVVTFSGQY